MGKDFHQPDDFRKPILEKPLTRAANFPSLGLGSPPRRTAGRAGPPVPLASPTSQSGGWLQNPSRATLKPNPWKPFLVLCRVVIVSGILGRCEKRISQPSTVVP